MTKNRTPTPVYQDPGMHPGLEVKGLNTMSIPLRMFVVKKKEFVPSKQYLGVGPTSVYCLVTGYDDVPTVNQRWANVCWDRPVLPVVRGWRVRVVCVHERNRESVFRFCKYNVLPLNLFRIYNKRVGKYEGVDTSPNQLEVYFFTQRVKIKLT